MDGYIRVSVVGGRAGERFQSPAQQRDSIEAWAKANGVRVGAWHEDLDRSGGTMDRPGMNAALNRIDRGLSGGLIVARLDRFARTLVGGLTLIERLHAKGARVVSVAENVDPATPMGRAMLGLLLLMAQWQRDQADEHLGLAQHRAASAGRFPGKTPYGYRRDDRGLTVVDPDAAQVLVGIFEQRAAGDGWRTIADRLTRQGIPTPLGRERWAPSTLTGLVRSEAPLGVFVGPRGLRIEDAWPAIVTREIWEHANQVRGRRPDPQGYQDRLLAGLCRCAGCRHVMVREVNHHGFVSYGCQTRGCPQRPSVGAALLDGYVTGLIDQRLARLRVQPRQADVGSEDTRLTEARDAAVRELEQWRDDTGLRTVLGEHDWRAGLLARARARDDAETELAQHRAQTGLAALADLPGDVAPTIESMPWEVRRALVETFLHSVWVRRSQARGPAARRHLARRVRVVWTDDRARPELPRRGRPDPGPLDW